MKTRQIYEYALVELNKRKAPSLLLEDYNYFINKAISQYVNKIYNLYEINQQKTDDLRVLRSSTSLTVSAPSNDWASSDLFSKTYEVDLPDDYLHILNCIVEYTVKSKNNCYNIGDKFQIGAKRGTSDMMPQIISNYYARPSYKNPYYYINNINTSNTFPTSDNLVEILDVDIVPTTSAWSGSLQYYAGDFVKVVSALDHYFVAKKNSLNDVPGSGNPTFTINSTNTQYWEYLGTPSSGQLFIPTNEKESGKRYGNSSKVRMEVRYGKNNTTFELSKVYIDYLKVPQFVNLTQDQIDSVDDISQIVEFPDYVCQEIINELIKLLLENSSDPRIQSQPIVSQSIAN